MHMMAHASIAALIVAISGTALQAELKPGTTAPGFTLPGTDGTFHSLDDLAGEKATVVIFTCNHCPYAEAYEPRIIAVQKDYGDRGVNVIGINPNLKQGDGLADMQKRAAEHGFNFPYLRDRTQLSAEAYGAACTPHVFVLDAGHVIRYVGRIDDAWKDAKKAKHHDLRNALDAILAGKQVPVAETLAQGCSIKWRHPGKTPRTPFSVAPEQTSVAPLTRGDKVPDALVSNLEGQPVWLHDRLAGKRTVLIVFRGGWCPYCMTHLAALQKVHDEITARGYQVIAISPDTPAGTEKGTQEHDLTYELLSDPTFEAALAMGLAFRLSPDLIPLYKEYKIPLRSAPGYGHPVLPVPAVYLVDASGKVTFAHTNPDYKVRLEAQTILDAAK